MQFIHNLNFTHTFYKDLTWVNYTADMPNHLNNDNGYINLMTRYGKIEAFNFKGHQIAIPKIFIKGTADYFRVKAYKGSAWLSFELPSHILHDIIKTYFSKNRNKFTDLSLYVEDDILLPLHNSQKKVNDINTITTTITVKYLSDFFTSWNVTAPSVEIVNYNFEKKGMLPIKELVEVFPYKERYLERLFYKEAGTIPYRFICLVKFNYVIIELQAGDFRSFNQFLQNYNYHDHFHFEKDFEIKIGQSIKSYNHEFNPLLTKGLARVYNKLPKIE